jgi:O-antigen/teichoic acid export membrane protein
VKPGPSDIVARGKAGFVWNFAFRFSTHVANFLMGAILARLIPPAEFGALAIVMVFVTIITSLSDAGLVSALTQRRHVHRIHYDSVFYCNIAGGVALFAATAAGAPLVAKFYGDPRLAPLVIATGTLILMNAASAVPQVVLKRHLLFRQAASLRLGSSIAGGIIGILMALRGYSIWSLVGQQLAAGLATLVMGYGLSRWRPRLAFSARTVRQLSGYSGAMYAAKALDVVFSGLDVLVFARLIPLGSMGNYQRAKSFNALIMSYSFQSVVDILFPVLSLVNRNTARVRNLVERSLQAVSFASFLLMGLAFVTADELIAVVYGEAWRPAGEYLKYVTIASFAFPVSSLLSVALSSRGVAGKFLGIEIIKKAVFALHLWVGYAFGFHVFLECLVVRAVIAVGINVVAVARELRIGALDLSRPVLAQGAIFLVALGSGLVAREPFGDRPLAGACLGALVFLALYVGTSRLFATSAYETASRLVSERLQRATLPFHQRRAQSR